MSKFGAKWVFELEEDFEFDLTPFGYEDTGGPYDYLDSKGQCRLTIHVDGRAIIHKGYAWDGCTPKFQLFDILLGIPDGVIHTQTKRPKCYYASLVHDVLYQFLGCDLPINRADADHLFLFYLSRDHFILRSIYFWAVRLFGGIFLRCFTRWKRDYRNQRKEAVSFFVR